MYHRVHIKRVPIRLLCRLDVASSRVRGTKQAQWEHGLIKGPETSQVFSLGKLQENVNAHVFMIYIVYMLRGLLN